MTTKASRIVATMVLLAAVAYVVYACCPISVTITAPPEGSRGTFNAASPGEKAIPCTADAVPAAATPAIVWSCEDVSGTQEIWNPDPPQGGDVTLTLRTLPPSNSDFGNTWVKASVCDVSDTNTFKLFFTEEATNNPGGTYRNWYYYWGQTSAHYGTHNYDANSSRGWTDFVNGAWRSYIGYGCNQSAVAETWSNAEGIDFFAHYCRHEERRRLDMSSLWGANNNRNDGDDPDGDYLPTDNGTVKESDLGKMAPHLWGYNPGVRASVDDHLDYGDGWTDCEDYAMHRQAAWANGSADGSDWANPGHQY